MAFYIEIEKIEQTKFFVRYKYYTSPENVGVLELDLKKEKIIEIDAAPEDKNGLLFQRASMQIFKHWKNGEFPEKTYWAS